MNPAYHVLVNWILVKILLMSKRKKTYVERRRQDPWCMIVRWRIVGRSKIRLRTEEDNKSSEDVC